MMPVQTTQRKSLKKKIQHWDITHIRRWAQSPRQQKGRTARTRTITADKSLAGPTLTAVHSVCTFWFQPNKQSHPWADIWSPSLFCPQVLHEPDSNQQIHQAHQAPLCHHGKCFCWSLGHSSSSFSCVPPLSAYSLSPRLHLSTLE